MRRLLIALIVSMPVAAFAQAEGEAPAEAVPETSAEETAPSDDAPPPKSKRRRARTDAVASDASAPPVDPPTAPKAQGTAPSPDGALAKIIADEAQRFFRQMLAGDARSLVERAAFPFYLEDRKIGAPEELFQEWLKSLRAKRTDLLTLQGVEVLTPAEMERKYGKPPARLASFPWRSSRTYLAVGNISGHASVAIFRDQGDGNWKVVGYHD